MITCLSKCDWVHSRSLSPPSWCWTRTEVPREGSDFTLLRERVCISLSINTWGLDWTHLESLAVNEREREVTGLYRPIIICLGGTSSDQLQQWEHLSYHTHGEPAIDPKQAALGWSMGSIDRLIPDCLYDSSQHRRIDIHRAKQAETPTNYIISLVKL